MRLAYVALYYDYGKPEQGTSYETDNLEAGFREWDRDGVEVDYFHPDVEGEMESLQGRLDEFDAIFHVAFNESIDLPEDIARAMIAKGGRVIQWDCDASWRFHNWILPRRNRVTDFVTTHSSTVPWYQQSGMRVVRSQWGGSPLYVRDSNAQKKYDVSFIGQKHGIRPQIMEHLYNEGIKVDLLAIIGMTILTGTAISQTSRVKSKSLINRRYVSTYRTHIRSVPRNRSRVVTLRSRNWAGSNCLPRRTTCRGISYRARRYALCTPCPNSLRRSRAIWIVRRRGCR